MTVSASIPCAEMLIQFVTEVTGDHLCPMSNPDSEVRSSKRVYNAALYHSSRPNCQIRICHCCTHCNTISQILIIFFLNIKRVNWKYNTWVHKFIQNAIFGENMNVRICCLSV